MNFLIQIQIFNDIFGVIRLFETKLNLNSKFEFSNCHFFFRQVHDLVSTFPNGFGTKRRRSLTVTRYEKTSNKKQAPKCAHPTRKT